MKTAFKILGIIILIGIIAFGIHYVFKEKINYDSLIEQRDVKIEALDKEIEFLRKDTANLRISRDSIIGLIQEGDIKLSDERRKRLEMEYDLKEELAELQKLDDQDQVEYFIASTYGDYPVVKSGDFYLIDLSSITFANNALVNIEYYEVKIESFIDEISDLNKQIERYKGLVGNLNAFITKQDEMLNNRNLAIVNMNIKIALLEGQNKKLMRNKWIWIGLGGLGASYAALK